MIFHLSYLHLWLLFLWKCLAVEYVNAVDASVFFVDSIADSTRLLKSTAAKTAEPVGVSNVILILIDAAY
jgi:hypothetical protein